MTAPETMDDARRARADAWLARLGAWAGYGPAHRRAAIACEVVRGIVTVDEPEYAYAVAWAGYDERASFVTSGHPTAEDWVTALELYGPAQTPEARIVKSGRLAQAARRGDRQSVGILIR